MDESSGQHSVEHDQLTAALTFDPLAEAERATGESYKDDGDTMRLGLGLAMLHNKRKENLLRGARDSFYAMRFAESLSLMSDLGFQVALRDKFDGRDGTDEFVILWHPDGLLATTESYGTHRNSAKVYYNYRHESGGYPGGGLTSSGHMSGEVWVGDHDAREGIRHSLDRMRAEGKFLARWVERPFLWLLAYADTDGEYDYDAINADRISRLPDHVRGAITPHLLPPETPTQAQP